MLLLFLNQVATIVSMFATVYMRVFLKESFPDSDSSEAFLEKEPGIGDSDGNSSEKIDLKKVASVGKLINLLKSKYLKTCPSTSFFLFLRMVSHFRCFVKPFATGQHFQRLQSSPSLTVLPRVDSRPHYWYYIFFLDCMLDGNANYFV